MWKMSLSFLIFINNIQNCLQIATVNRHLFLIKYEFPRKKKQSRKKIVKYEMEKKLNLNVHCFLSSQYVMQMVSNANV